jgi:hypothetical protein
MFTGVYGPQGTLEEKMFIRELRHLKQTRSLGNGHMMVYTVASGYDCQFLGAMQRFPSSYIWKAQSEPRNKFFTWLALHDRVLTADNMIKKELALQ